MISISVLFFGATADEADVRELEMSFAEKVTAAEVFAEVVEKFPALRNHKLLYAVNQEYSSGGEQIKNGDELAIFTAVSGG